MNIQIKKITPELAETWLARNNKNRSINDSNLQKLKSQIRKGNWHEETGEAIKIDRNGNLIDGQHRLTAVVETGISIKTLVAMDLAPEARNYIDTGKSRSSRDLLTMNNVKYANYVDPIARASIDANLYGAKNASNKDILDAYYNDQEEIDLCAKRAAFLTGKSNHFIKGADIAIVLYLVRKVDPDEGNKFIKTVCTGLGINSETSPEYAIRQWLIRQASEKDPVNARARKYTWIKMWNKYRLGEDVHKVNVQRKPIKAL